VPLDRIIRYTSVMRSPEPTAEEIAALALLEARLGHLHVRQRLGLERDYEAHALRGGTHVFHPRRWLLSPAMIRVSLRIVGLHARGRRNAAAMELRENEVFIPGLPETFNGYTILHLTDLHLDISNTITEALCRRVQSLEYDLCVVTGDYRARTYGPFEPALAELRHLRPHLHGPVYAILGNHDTIRLVPAMEQMGYQMLLNESVRIDRDGEAIYLAGIDDPHAYRTENFHRAAHEIPPDAVSILLAHTPDVYRRAAHAGFDLMLCGHTHGGQICLPGGVPVMTDSRIPRRLARGAWRYHDMAGYTSAGAGASILDVRLNCPPEVTLHRLRRGTAAR